MAVYNKNQPRLSAKKIRLVVKRLMAEQYLFELYFSQWNYALVLV